MKHFLIEYQFTDGTREDWHKEIAKFIAAIDNDPELKGKILYRCMKKRDSNSYYHMAAAVDEAASNALSQRAFFKPYQDMTKSVGGGKVTVSPLEIIAQTAQHP